MSLFMFSQKVGQGLPLWLPKGAYLRDKLIDFTTLVLNFKYYPSEERTFVNVNKHSSIKNAIEVHWPSQYYQGYSKLFKETLKSNFDHVIISNTTEFFDGFFEYFEGS